MSSPSPTLHMVCGKIAAGKSTLAAKLAKADGTVLVSEDAWLSALFSQDMTTLADYVRCSSKLRNAMGPHIASLLRSGVSVVLDFPANTVENRDWMRHILQSGQARHQMHVLNVSDEVCLARLRERNARGDHPFAPTVEQFHRVSKYYMPPSPREGFEIVVHDGTE